MEGKRTFTSQYIKDDEGRLTRVNAIIRERWVRPFNKLLNTLSPTLDPSIVDELQHWPPCRPLDDVPSEYEVEEAMRALANGKAVGSDAPPAELMKFFADVRRRFHHPRSETSTISSSLCGGGVAHSNNGTMLGLRCFTRRNVRLSVTIIVAPALVAHADKVLLKVITGRPSDYCERENILTKEQCGFRPQYSTVGMMFVVRRLRELARKDTPLYTCFVDLTKAFNSVDRTLLLGVLARFDVPPRILATILQFHNAMQTCVRLENEECSDEFDVGQEEGGR